MGQANRASRIKDEPPCRTDTLGIRGCFVSLSAPSGRASSSPPVTATASRTQTIIQSSSTRSGPSADLSHARAPRRRHLVFLSCRIRGGSGRRAASNPGLASPWLCLQPRLASRERRLGARRGGILRRSPFALLMGDHLFEAPVLQAHARAQVADGESISRWRSLPPRPAIAADERRACRLSGGRITAIGKDLDP